MTYTVKQQEKKGKEAGMEGGEWGEKRAGYDSVLQQKSQWIYMRAECPLFLSGASAAAQNKADESESGTLTSSYPQWWHRTWLLSATAPWTDAGRRDSCRCSDRRSPPGTHNRERICVRSLFGNVLKSLDKGTSLKGGLLATCQKGAPGNSTVVSANNRLKCKCSSVRRAQNLRSWAGYFEVTSMDEWTNYQIFVSI